MTSDPSSADPIGHRNSALLAQIRTHRVYSGAAVALVTALIGTATKLLPGIGSWFDSHPSMSAVRIVALIALWLLAWMYLYLDGQNADLRKQLAEAQRQLVHRQHDAQLFQRWSTDYPPGAGLRAQLRAFDADTWEFTLPSAVDQLREQWVDQQFIDGELQGALQRLLDAAKIFSTWLYEHSDAPGSGNILVNWQVRNPHAKDSDAGVQNGIVDAHSIADIASELDAIGQRKGL